MYRLSNFYIKVIVIYFQTTKHISDGSKVNWQTKLKYLMVWHRPNQKIEVSRPSGNGLSGVRYVLIYPDPLKCLNTPMKT